MRRRDFLRSVSLATLAAGTAGCLGIQGWEKSLPGDKPTNILFVICDDLNDSVERWGGHPQAVTPNLVRLMERGVSFTNAHSNAPICGPSRASFLSGLYPHTSGYYGFNQNRRAQWYEAPVLKEALNFPQYFTDIGYTVHGTGKIPHTPREFLWAGRDGEVRYGHLPDYGPWPWDGKATRGQAHPQLPPPLNERKWDGFGPLSRVPDFDPETPGAQGGWANWTFFDHTPFRYEGPGDRDLLPDERSAQWAAERIAQPQAKPFLMAVGFMLPHTPFYAPDRFFEMIDPEQVELPPYRKDDLRDCARVLAEKTSPDDWGREVFDAVTGAGGEAVWRDWLHAYLACVACADAQLGVLLDALEASPNAENTAVLFTSDNGYHLGEKDHMFKNTVWEEGTRVPLVISAPGMARGAACEHPVSLIDLYPTMVDLAGHDPATVRVTATHGLDGHSLLPFLRDPQHKHWTGPDSALSAVAGDGELGFDEPGKPGGQHFSLRDERWRYIRTATGEEELYDHQNDPQEWNNLAGDPAHAALLKRKRRELEGMIPDWEIKA